MERVDTIRDRLLRRTVPGPAGCLDWTGALGSGGYGMIAWSARGIRAALVHRVAYELATGERLGPGDVVAHRCDRRVCCNPAHLFKTTQAGNIADKMAKGREVRGTRVVTAKLDDETVRSLRRDRDRGVSMSRLAASYGISLTHVKSIVKRRAWRWLQ